MESENARRPSDEPVTDGSPSAGSPSDGSPSDGTAVAFREDVRVTFDGESVSLQSPVSSFTLRPVRGGLHTALTRLSAGPHRHAALVEGLAAAERAQLQRFLERAGRLLTHSVMVDGRELARVEHTARGVRHQPLPVASDARVRLSKFALCRSLGDHLVLESPLAKVRFVLLDAAARHLVAALGAAREVDGLAGEELKPAEALELLGHLAGAGFVESAAPDGTFPSEAEPALRQWDFHDLLFHSRIRSGRYDDALGAVYPYAGQIDPRPAVKPPPGGPAVELHRPGWDEIADRDPGLTAALEARRSIRSYGDEPLTAAQLGEFLYRVQRVRAHFEPAPGEGDEAVSRPYPSGGRAYELELYLTVRRCDGLDPGIYYYDPVAHRLVLVNTTEADRESMLGVASMATGLEASPDVLITMTSRFQRLSWKYRAIAYAATLRHTGVLYQTMYLVATAMGLAPCGLGNGDADMSARVLGLDYLEESSVGDFLLGSRRPQDALTGPPDDGASAGGPPGDSPPDDGWRMVNSAEWVLRAAAPEE